MKIAIAGAGELSRYFYEEFTRYGHDTVALTRSPKAFLDNLSIEQRITDYTVESLISALIDCQVVISTIAAQGPDHIGAHLAILEACKRSPHCKRIIPSEWTGNIEDYPDQPMYMYESREPIRQALAAQQEVEWTLILNGWFMEYLLPQSQRHFSDCGDGWPMDHERKVFMLYDRGSMPVTLTSARDVARAVARLVEQSSWEKYTHLAGESMTWKELFDVLQKRDPGWKLEKRTLAEAVRQMVAVEKSGASPVRAHLQLLGYTECNQVKLEKANRQREKYFSGVHFRGVQELLEEGRSRPHGVV